jgi:hypothetical protein
MNDYSISRFFSLHTHYLNTHKMTRDERMRKALAELESCSKPNYVTVAEKYQLERTTLPKRARGKTEVVS